MTNLLKLVGEISKGFLIVPFFRMLFYGLIFSVIMTFLIGWTQGAFEVSAAFPYITNPSHSFWIPVVFVSFTFLFAFAGYLSNLQLKEDILSPIRRKLVGIWEVRARTWVIEKGRIVQDDIVTHCTIGIEDVGRKLILHFDVKNSDVFSDQSLDITNVLIAFQGEPKKLIYFNDHELQLKSSVGTGNDVTVKFPFLGVLTINSRNETIDEMTGLWYDIDNSIFNMAKQMPGLEGLNEITNGVEKGAITFKGALTFSRIVQPVGD
jgi:hypothetical protein